MTKLLSIAAVVVLAVVTAFGAGRFSGHSAAQRQEEKQRLEAHREMRRNEKDAESQDDDALAERITRRGL